MKTRITASDVLRRQESLRETTNASEFLNEDSMADLYYNRADKTHHKYDVLPFMKYCAEHKNAAIKHWRPCICFMEEYIDDAQVKQEFGRVLQKLDKEDLKEIASIDTKPMIHEMSQDYLNQIKVCDRIYNNHTQVCEKVKNLNNIITENNRPDQVDDVLWEICKSFDRFKMDDYIKLNASIEEAMFLYEMYDIPVDDNKVVDRCVDYYMMKKDCAPRDVELFKQVVDQNPCVEYQNKPVSHCGEICKNFKSSCEKTEETMCNFLTNFFTGNAKDICDNLMEIFYIFRIICLQNHPLKDILDSKVIPFLMEKITEKRSDPYYRDILKAVNACIDDTIQRLKTIYNHTVDDEEHEYPTNTRQDAINQKYNIQNLLSALYKLQNQIKEELGYAYTNYNLKQIDQGGIFNFSESTDVLTLNEFKKFKFNNLLNTCKEIDAMLRKKAKAIGMKIKGKIFKIKEKLTEEVSVYDMIDENGFIDMVVTSFVIDESCIEEYHDILTEICQDLNSQYFIKEAGVTCYYMIQPDGAEIHMKQNTSISLTESESEEMLHHLSPEDLERVTECVELLERFDNINPDIDIIQEATKTFSKYPEVEYCNLFVEASSYAGVKEDLIQEMFEEINLRVPKENGFYFATWDTKENYKPERDIPYAYQLEALSLMYSIVEAVKEENDPKKNTNTTQQQNKIVNNTTEKPNTIETITNKKTKEEKKQERAEKAVATIQKSVNNVKLALNGIKKGIKNLSAKEQAASRNLDAGFSMLVKSMKNALVSDRREAIIKGSVIPSFSKCIKMGVVLAGITLINPLLGIITAVGGFATSKKLTKKERALLLDDIDVELEMIEKEIQNAEARGQMKKLRALMRTKKELQRQYQRINLNIRVGKDIVPGSTDGMKQFN